MDERLINTLKSGAKELGVDLSEGALALFDAYLTELKAWNKKINLTAIETDGEIVTKHFLDSLTPYKYLTGVKRLLDIGAGGGFPGLPLKIVAPALEVVLMDAVEKKVHFMRHIIRKLGLKGAFAVAGRVEDPSVIDWHKGTFDAVISRAFTELKVFLSMAAPYVGHGGMIIAMKGPQYKEELEGAEGLKGFKTPEVYEARVPFTDRTTVIIIFRKDIG
ncbi:MAG: 16S rRNA (guanine(527)-N(7))-methyltransferase RsmG [Deltaproteobacteria bacterium]|nr:16S rRNA (guanine(527)-N(7))-methyltransferase RsmG [Deltaproteobacteria bacterium]